MKAEIKNIPLEELIHTLLNIYEQGFDFVTIGSDKENNISVKAIGESLKKPIMQEIVKPKYLN